MKMNKLVLMIKFFYKDRYNIEHKFSISLTLWFIRYFKLDVGSSKYMHENIFAKIISMGKINVKTIEN